MNESKNQIGTSLKLLVKTSFIVFIGVVLSKILSYSYRIIIARYYGAEIYGLLSLSTMIAGWFIAIASLGFYDGLSRFIPLYRGKKEISKIRYLLRWSFGVLTITSVLSAIILFLTSGIIANEIFHNSYLKIYLQIFSIVIPFTVLANPFLALLRGYEKIKIYSFIFNIAQNLVKVVTVSLMICLGFNGIGAPISWLVGLISLTLFSYIACKYKLPQIFVNEKYNPEEMARTQKEVFSYSRPLLFYGVITVLFYWIDSFFIGYYYSAVEVGIYNSAVPIATLLLIAPELFMQLFFPMITKEYARKNIHLIKELSKQVNKWIFTINLPAFVLLIIFPGVALNILFGAEYLPAKTALIILAIGSLITSITSVSNSLLSMAGKSKLILRNMLIACVLNIILNFILVPLPFIFGLDNSLGITGAAIATLISLTIFNLMIILETQYPLKIFPFRRKMITLLISALISFFGLHYVTQTWSLPNLFWKIIVGIIFVLVYFLLVFISKSLDRNDYDIFNSIKTYLASIKIH